ncbi:hypothetical protein N7925_00290 [Streptomyces sp. CA-278952]|nr:hypothetical protein [Streptomyces sp. CA-278952]WDG26876.1 hypothetical protein N7925_00290 [Streptomyces sp. CA-278952]
MTVYPGGHFHLNTHASAVTDKIAAWPAPAAASDADARAPAK